MKPGDRFKIGSRVCTLEGAEVEIVRHGRDTSGVYTEIKFADGSKERVHRSFLRAMRARSGR